MRKKGIFVLILVVLGVLIYNYIYQDHRDISEENPAVTIASQELSKQFSTDAKLSEQKYNDKTIQITGTITELNTLDFTLDEGVFCQFEHELSNKINLGEIVTIKGRCIGYDDLLEQVKLNECSVIKK